MFGTVFLPHLRVFFNQNWSVYRSLSGFIVPLLGRVYVGTISQRAHWQLLFFFSYFRLLQYRTRDSIHCYFVFRLQFAFPANQTKQIECFSRNWPCPTTRLYQVNLVFLEELLNVQFSSARSYQFRYEQIYEYLIKL